MRLIAKNFGQILVWIGSFILAYHGFGMVGVGVLMIMCGLVQIWL